MEIGKKYLIIESDGTKGYCPQYVHQWVEVVSNQGWGYYNVKANDGRTFMCPKEFLKENWTSLHNYGKNCECGAQKTYGKQTIGLHHSFWCPKRKD